MFDYEFLDSFDPEEIINPTWLGYGDIFFFVNPNGKRASPLLRMSWKDPYRGWHFINMPKHKDFNRFEPMDRIVIVWSNEKARKARKAKQ